MSLSKAKDPQSSHFGDYKSFRGYIKKEVYWAHLFTEASLMICTIQVEGPQLPMNFEEFYRISLKNHIQQVVLFMYVIKMLLYLPT